MDKEQLIRNAHLQWCKNRAIKYINSGNMNKVFTSMLSDLEKHENTCDHPGIDLGMRLIIAGKLQEEKDMKKFIDGFN